MVYPDGDIQYTARRFRSIGWELLDLFRFIPWMMGYQQRAARMLGKYFRHDEDRYCDWVNGAFFLIRRELVAQMPAQKLDDRFFMYGEDHLWCYQARQLGYQVLFYAGTTIVHINSGSTDLSRQLQLRKTMLRHELEIMKERKGNGLYFQAIRLIYGTKEFFRNLVKGLIFKTRGKLVR
jgi:GT2 family glycosyltransferase